MTKLEEYAKRLGVETSSTPGDTLTDIDAGKAGYDKYLADVESYKKAQEQAIAESEANKSWWGKVSDFILQANQMSNNMSDNPAVSGFNAAVEAYKNMPEDNKPSDDWTDEERWIFGEKYASDSKSAYDYAKRLNAAKAQQKKEQQAKAIERWTNRNAGNQILGSAASLGLNATMGGLGFLDAMAQMAGRGEIQQHDILLPHEIAGTMQGAVASDLNKYGTLNEKIPIIGGKGWGDVYGLGMSIAQSKLAVTAGGGVGSLAQFFGMSASQGVSDALERGATGEQALAFGTVSGLAEAIPEMISLDKFIGIASSEAVESVFKNVLKMAGEEAGEELTTSLITEVADRWIMGGKSEFQLRVNELVASGMSLEEAKKAAWKQTINNIAFDTLSGAISGGVSGALGTGVNRVNQRLFQTEANETAKKALTPEQDNLIAEAKKYDTTKKRASALEKKLAEGKELTGYDLRMLANQVSEASRTADVETTRKAIVQQMKDGGLSDGEAKKLGEIALNKAIGNEVSKVQDLMLKRSEVGSKVYNQISADVMKSGVGDSEWARSTPIERLRAEKEAIKQNSEIKVENKPKTGLEQLKTDIAAKYGAKATDYKINTESLEGKIEKIDGGYAYKKSSADSKIHTEGITSPLTEQDIAELSAIEKIANELGIDIHVYETKVDNKTGERSYTDKDGKKYSDNGFYNRKDNSIHIDLRAGEDGEGTMLYTASHEVVHFIKENASEQYEALEKLVTKELIQGGFSIDKLIDKQKDILRKNGWDGTESDFEAVAREEMVAEACQSFLASKNAVAEIRALKSENRGLWNALKKFFTSLFAKINKIYKELPPDAPEGKYIAEMRNAVKPIRDAFMEGAVAASKNAAQNKKTFEKSYQKSKDIRKNARYVKEHRTALEKLGDTSTTVPMDELLKRYDKLMEIWDSLGGELNSEFLKQWNNKSGKDRAFTVFKAQAGYKYNVELSSMCKKGIPLFEAIDTIVRGEVVNQLDNKTIGKAEKEILYELLKEKNFEIPCAICYVEQARQREGEIINAFLDGKIEKTPAGKTKTYKIGWNETFTALEKGMKAQGVPYTFPEVSREIATDKYTKAEMPSMDARTEKAFYNTLLKLINKEITRYNAEKDPKAKARMPLNSVTPSEIKRCLGGTLSANLKLYKTIAMNPDSRFRINNDLLYSSATTTNLATFYNDLYSLFNMQGGVAGYKSKQGTVVYWGDILSKKWDSSKLRKEGGVRNQSNSDFMMYTLLDQAQMYMDFTAKGYYLQAYTKVIGELKLFGLSRGKINASLIPKVEIYRMADGIQVDEERTRENAGLDKKGNPIYDDIEGIPHEEAFMLIEDPEYSKSIGGICIGYSDKHISKLLADKRVQLIIGYHDKTDDPDKRYRGARYAKNYNGENEARVRNSDGTFTTKHVGFNQFVMAAEKLFKKDTTSVEYNGKTYKYDDIPKLAADMYLKMCDEKNYIPAYDQFKGDENYYKLLADFSLYDSEGHYAPHQKVAYNMPDVVPYLDDNGQKQYMPTRDYVKKELKKELTVRDDISAALSDHSENGLIPRFVKAANELHEQNKDIRHQARVGIASDGKKIFQSNFPKGTPKAAKSERILGLIQDVWSKKPISLVVSNGEKSRTILAQFDPTIDKNKIIPTDASKIAGGNRHGNHTEQRVTLDLADDYYEIASDAKYNYSKKETGKKLNTHNDVNMWHYFFTEIYFMEQEGDTYTPYTVTVNVKEKDDGDFVYSFNAEKEPSTRQTLHADVITYKGDNGELFLDNSIPQSTEDVNTKSEIRHKTRSTVKSAPYISPTATSIVTDIDSEYKYTKKDMLYSGAIASQVAFTNAQAGIESIGKKYHVKDIEALVQAARVASKQADEMISGNQYRIGSAEKTYLGEGLQKIYQPVEEMGEEKKQAFFDYLFHQHNADRMSLERRSNEWNDERKQKLAEYNKRFVGLEKEQTSLIAERAKLTRKVSDSERRQQIRLRLDQIKRELATVAKFKRELQKQVDSFTPLKNKPVLGYNREAIETRKKEIHDLLTELYAKRKALGKGKQNAAEALEVAKQIVALSTERDTLSAEVSEQKSREIIAEYEKNYPEFKAIAEKVWNYNKNLNQYRVDTGLIDQAQFDYMQKLYPHYVPTYRADSKTGIAAVKGKNNVAISQSVKSATGSTKDLLNPIVIMARQTMETVRAGRINQIANALYDGAKGDKTYLAEISKKKVKNSEVVDIDPTELRPKGNQVTFFKNGEKIVLQVSSEIFAGFDAFTPSAEFSNPLLRAVSKATDTFKKLVTSANPLFIIRNTIRDVQDAGINTKYASIFIKNYGRAIAEIKNDGEMWKLYRAMGGSNVSFFDFDKGFKMMQSKKGFGKKLSTENENAVKMALAKLQDGVQWIENANNFVEMLPRLAEFISSIEAGNTAEQAMLDAADVTTNFARTGKITKALNSTVIPFLNPAIQGASKAVRNVVDVVQKRSIKEAAILAAKAMLVGVAPMLLNALLYRDDEDYEDLKDSDKENNFLIKFGDTFLKIPRGRMASVIGGAVNQAFITDEADWGQYLKNASTQMNPMENMARHIASPFLDVANNVTWYGSAIEGKQFENVSPSERYDASTSSIAIAIGKVLNYSPKKIHYLLDQYSGVIGDILLPATSKQAEKDFFTANMTLDPVTSNKLSDSFYDIYYEAQYAKNDGDKVAEYQVKHLNRVKSAISELYDEKNKIQNSNKSDKEKLAETRAIQILINQTYKTAIEDYNLITNAIKATSKVDDKYRYTEVLRLVYGAETALKNYDEDVYDKSKLLKKSGLTYEEFYKYYFSTRGIESDKDKNGNTISGSKKAKVIEKIDSLSISDEKKLLLISVSGYAIDNEKDRAKLIKYINNLKLTAKEKELLAELCGLAYKNGKITSKK